MNCCANLSNLVIYRALLSDPIVNALRRPKEFFAPELEGLLLVAAEEKGLTGIIPLEYLLSAIVHEQNVFSAVAEKNDGKIGEGLARAAAHDIVIMREFVDDVLIVIKTIHCWETIRRQCSGLCQDAVSWKKFYCMLKVMQTGGKL